MTIRRPLVLPRTRLTSSKEGPPIRRDPYHDDDPIFDGDDQAQDGSPIFERLAVMQIASTTFIELMDYLTSRPPEAAGVLIGPKNHDGVTHFVADETGAPTAVSFTLGHIKLNQLLAKYVPAGLDAKGIVHSHPLGCVSPSAGDLAYVAQCFASGKGTLDRFLLPLVVGGRFYPYIVFRDQPDVAEFAQVVLF